MWKSDAKKVVIIMNASEESLAEQGSVIPDLIGHLVKKKKHRHSEPKRRISSGAVRLRDNKKRVTPPSFSKVNGPTDSKNNSKIP
jgi:hypothetical protein